MAESSKKDAVLAAVERLVLRGGVGSVTMRAVADEAGVSLRLVQYYGSNKHELLQGALARLASRSLLSWGTRRSSTPDTPAGIVRAFLVAALPVDEESKQFHRFGVSLEQLALLDPDGDGAFYLTHIDAVIQALAEALSPHLGADRARGVAEQTVAFSHGIGTLLMAGLIGTARAAELIDRFPHVSAQA
ncbi:TetR/AcrR family transcriptional regulator [Propionibacteriaceae bacterium Y1685]